MYDIVILKLSLYPIHPQEEYWQDKRIQHGSDGIYIIHHILRIAYIMHTLD